MDRDMGIAMDIASVNRRIDEEEHRIPLLGGTAVGKHELAEKWLDRSGIDEVPYGTLVTNRKQIILDGRVARVDVDPVHWFDGTSLVCDHYARTGTMFILVYNILDRESFEVVQDLHEQIWSRRHVHLDCDFFAIVLVGNKCDLESQRRVSYEGQLSPSQISLLPASLLTTNSQLIRFLRTKEGERLAEAFGCPFFEASAATGHNVNLLFETFIRLMRQKRYAFWEYLYPAPSYQWVLDEKRLELMNKLCCALM